VEVEAVSEPVILSGYVEDQLAHIFVREALGIDTKPRRFRAVALGVWRQV